jgi:CheY-like chemotaxis protein
MDTAIPSIKEGTPAPGGKHTVLYVEDSRTNTHLITQILAKFRPDIELITVDRGEDALELAATRLPVLVLMDINLPGIDGVETMLRLREVQGLQHIPMIAVSANAMPEDKERALEAGFLRYFTKPIAMIALLQLLEELLVEAVPD